jgi:general secretion pathway protein B
MAELPVPMQDQIPKMSISVHAYSARPADRLVGINGRLLREGDYPAPDLRLEQITPDGMILSYKGYRFRHGIR